MSLKHQNPPLLFPQHFPGFLTCVQPRLGGRHAFSQVIDLRRVLSSLRPSFFGNAIWVARLEAPPSPSLVPSSFPPTPVPLPTPPNHPRYGALLAAPRPRPTGPLCLAAAARDAHAAIAASSAIYEQVAAALSGRSARGAAGLRRLTQPGVRGVFCDSPLPTTRFLFFIYLCSR